MQGARLGVGHTAARSFPGREARTRDRGALGKLLLRKAGKTARCAQHAAGNLDNRHVEIVCAALARVNVSVLYQFVDSAKPLWPTSVAPRRFEEGARPSTRA